MKIQKKKISFSLLQFLVFIILATILIAPFVKAYTINVEFESALSGYSIRWYECRDPTCSSVYTSPIIQQTAEAKKITTSLSISGNEKKYYSIYAYKQGYIPKNILIWADDEHRTGKINLLFDKKQNTRAEIKEVTLSDKTPKIGEELKITADIESAFHFSERGLSTSSYIPEDLVEEYYSALTNVELSITNSDGSEIYTNSLDLNIPIDQIQTAGYTWIPEKAGNYIIRITTNVIDTQADQSTTQLQTKSIPFTISSTQEEDNPPNAVIIYPQGNQEIYQQETMSFLGYGQDDGTIQSYSWVFEHKEDEYGSEMSFVKDTQYVQSIHFPLTGEWNVTFNVQDNAGQWDLEPAQITITVLRNPQTEQHAPKVKIISPEQGQTIKNIHTIQWTATDQDQIDSTLNIKIEYAPFELESESDNQDWNTIAELDNNPGFYNWDTTNINNGSYELRITVTDDTQRTAQSSILFSIKNEIQGKNPVAIFTYTRPYSYAPLIVRFDAGGSYDSDGTIEKYEWDFGGSGTAQGETYNYTYDNYGTYVVTLTVTDNDGNKDTTSKTILLKRPEPQPSILEVRKAEHKFSIMNIISKQDQTNHNINLYINIRNKGRESEKITITALNLASKQIAITNFKLDKNEETWQWLGLGKTINAPLNSVNSGNHLSWNQFGNQMQIRERKKQVIKIIADSGDYQDIRYVVVNV